MKRLSAILLILLLLCGCAAPAAAPETGTVFTDDLGRTVTVSNPQRVAALLGSFADVWVLSGGTLCAAPEDAWEDFGLDDDRAVNLGGATAEDVKNLLTQVSDIVFEKSGIRLEPEVRIW